MDNNDPDKNKFIERKKAGSMKDINRKKIFSIVMMLCFSLLLNAQDTDKQTDLMRSNGRIYVVIAVMLTILIGLVLYIVRLDRKLTKLEKEN